MDDASVLSRISPEVLQQARKLQRDIASGVVDVNKINEDPTVGSEVRFNHTSGMVEVYAPLSSTSRVNRAPRKTARMWQALPPLRPVTAAAPDGRRDNGGQWNEAGRRVPLPSQEELYAAEYNAKMRNARIPNTRGRQDDQKAAAGDSRRGRHVSRSRRHSVSRPPRDARSTSASREKRSQKYEPIVHKKKPVEREARIHPLFAQLSNLTPMRPQSNFRTIKMVDTSRSTDRDRGQQRAAHSPARKPTVAQAGPASAAPPPPMRKSNEERPESRQIMLKAEREMFPKVNPNPLLLFRACEPPPGIRNKTGRQLRQEGFLQTRKDEFGKITPSCDTSITNPIDRHSGFINSGPIDRRPALLTVYKGRTVIVPQRRQRRTDNDSGYPGKAPECRNSVDIDDDGLDYLFDTDGELAHDLDNSKSPPWPPSPAQGVPFRGTAASSSKAAPTASAVQSESSTRRDSKHSKH